MDQSLLLSLSLLSLKFMTAFFFSGSRFARGIWQTSHRVLASRSVRGNWWTSFPFLASRSAIDGLVSFFSLSLRQIPRAKRHCSANCLERSERLRRRHRSTNCVERSDMLKTETDPPIASSEAIGRSHWWTILLFLASCFAGGIW